MAKPARDRVALVTGAASGIGLATVHRLLESGWKVAAVDRDEMALASLSRELAMPRRLFTSALDVTDEAAAEKAVAMAGEALGGLDGVVNSAGIAADMHALETPVALLRKIMDVNVVGTFIVARAAARLMKDRGGGAIVNISSVSGLRGGKGRSAYGASKGAVVVLTQVLANDLARYKIRVNAVAPGPVETPMMKAVHTSADRALWMRHVPMRRYAEPDEVASVIEFLLDGRGRATSPARSSPSTAASAAPASSPRSDEPAPTPRPLPRNPVHRFGELHVELGQAARRVGRQRHVDTVPYVRPLRVMVHFLGHQRGSRHEAEGLAEVLELEGLLDGVAAVHQPPCRQPSGHALPRCLIELLCHGSWLLAVQCLSPSCAPC